jgi:hypothetical protein
MVNFRNLPGMAINAIKPAAELGSEADIGGARRGKTVCSTGIRVVEKESGRGIVGTRETRLRNPRKAGNQDGSRTLPASWTLEPITE